MTSERFETIGITFYNSESDTASLQVTAIKVLLLNTAKFSAAQICFRITTRMRVFYQFIDNKRTNDSLI